MQGTGWLATRWGVESQRRRHRAGAEGSDDPMLTWVPTWSNPKTDDYVHLDPIAPDLHWPDCDYFSLATELIFTGADKKCPNARGGDARGSYGLSRRMRQYRTRGPAEILVEGFSLKGLDY